MVQDGNTNLMLFSPDQIIAFVSQYFTLRVGDLIFTGTPKGVGKVEENDELELFLEGEKVLVSAYNKSYKNNCELAFCCNLVVSKIIYHEKYCITC
jgi:2-keto-4-pentenoate hydratase/2-oxohepta-3-ene-1,7-dioic acid hydratase in catechol pathway